MKLRALTLFSLLLAMSFTFVSCSKDKDEEPEPAPEQTTPDNLIAVDGSDATLVAVLTKSVTETPVGTFPINIGTAVAVFYDNAPTAFLDVGEVKVDENALSKQSNNSYVHMPSMTEPSGLDFGSSVNWKVAGGNGYSSIDHTTSISFPNLGEITSGTTVSRADGYTLTLSSISNADSALFHIGGVTKMLPGNATSYTFSADELAGLSTGANVVQVAAVNYESQDMGGKSVWFINEKVVSNSVTIE